jgi:hypothetical protein
VVLLDGLGDQLLAVLPGLGLDGRVVDLLLDGGVDLELLYDLPDQLLLGLVGAVACLPELAEQLLDSAVVGLDQLDGVLCHGGASWSMGARGCPASGPGKPPEEGRGRDRRPVPARQPS